MPSEPSRESLVEAHLRTTAPLLLHTDREIEAPGCGLRSGHVTTCNGRGPTADGDIADSCCQYRRVVSRGGTVYEVEPHSEGCALRFLEDLDRVTAES